MRSVSASGARIVRTTAAATAVGFAFSLFLCAYRDPAAIGWPLTPFIGAFWGALAGGLAGLGLRLAAMAATSTPRLREVPLAAVAVAVAGASVLISLALGRDVAVAESFIEPEVARGALVGAGLLPAVLTALAYWHLAHPRTRSVTSPTQ